MPKKQKSTVSYRWKPTVRLPKKIDADVFGHFLHDLSNRHGGAIDDGMIVDASRAKSSPTHELFEWDDSKAAEAHRREQAGWYRRHILVIVSGGKSQSPSKAIQQRSRIAYISTRNEAGKSKHRDAVQVMSDSEMRLEAIEDCLKLLIGIRRRFAHLTELSGLFAAIDAAVTNYGKKVG